MLVSIRDRDLVAAVAVTGDPRGRSAPPGHPPAPVLTDGRYDGYIRTVDTNRQRLVVDLVQVFQGRAAIDAAIANGLPREEAQVLYVWVRNQ